MDGDGVEAALLDAIARDPEQPEPYLVYADWLQARGELRGELVALQGASDERPGDHRISDAALDHVRAHRRVYLGELAPLLGDPHLRLGWRCGFIGSAEMVAWAQADRWTRTPAIRPEPALAALLDLESARFLTRLVVETACGDLVFVPEALAVRPWSALRQLWVGARDAWSSERDTAAGDFTGVWRQVPGLRELTIAGTVSRLGAIELPNLRRAMFRLSAATPVSVLEDIAAARWPNVECLHVWHPDAAEAIEALLARADLVTLGELGLQNARDADRIAGAVAGSPLAPQLNRLSLAHGALTDAGAAALLAHRDAFASLVQLDVSHTFVSADAAVRLRALAPAVIANGRRTGPPRVAIEPVVRDPDD